MRFRSAWLPCVLLTCCSCAARADVPKPEAAKADAPKEVNLFDPARHMRTSEVRTGMTGYGLSVFHGTKLERFEVEVISVMHNMMGPQQDVVLIRCRGQGLEHSGAIAGMSGSPIYLKDDQGRERMIGAFALGWEYSKDPIAGVRPIEEMLKVPADEREPVVARAQAAAWDARDLLQRPAGGGGGAQALAAPAVSKGIRPLSLPLAVGGVDPAFLQQIRPLLGNDSRFTLLQSGGAGGSAGEAPPDAKEAKLIPGAAIGVPIVRGDLEMSAIGTVTEVIGNRVFAFGHEFNSEGAVDLPMGVGYIHTVIPNQSISFKLGSLLRTDGAIYSDESVAIAGSIGKSPAMIPVEISVTTPQRPAAQTYRYEVTRHPRFTPFGTTSAVAAAIMGHSQLPAEFTIRYTLKMEFEDGHTVEMKNQTNSLMQAMELVRDLQTPVQFGIENPFKKVYPKRITGKVDVEPTIDTLVLRGAVTDKSVYRPGETVKVFVTTRPWRGQDETAMYSIQLPDRLPDGPLTLTVSDAQRFGMDEMRFSPFKYQTENVEDVFALLKTLTGDRSDQLYIRLTQPGEGVAIGRQALSKLPGGKKNILTHAPRPDVVAYPESTVTRHAVKSPLIGSADLVVTVAEHPERALQGPPMGMPVPMPPGGPQPPQQQPATPPAGPHP